MRINISFVRLDIHNCVAQTAFTRCIVEIVAVRGDLRFQALCDRVLWYCVTFHAITIYGVIIVFFLQVTVFSNTIPACDFHVNVAQARLLGAIRLLGYKINI